MILVAGDLNVDLILQGDVRPRFGQLEQVADDASLVLGSSAGITAVGLARLGAATRVAAVVGDDPFGRFCREALDVEGVDTSRVRTDPVLSTGVSVILSEPDDRAILTAAGALERLTPADVLNAATGCAHVHVASLFLLPTLAPALAEVFAELRRRGTTTSLDTNWDPAEGWRHIGDILAHTDVYLPNAHELRATSASLGRRGDDRELALTLAGMGPVVVVKDGARGGWSMDAAGHLTEVTAETVEVVDTTGAGDSFDAGYLAAMAEGLDDPHERLRWAVAAGSLSTRRPGGTAGQPRRTELVAALPA